MLLLREKWKIGLAILTESLKQPKKSKDGVTNSTKQEPDTCFQNSINYGGDLENNKSVRHDT